MLQREHTEPAFAKALLSFISHEWECEAPEFIRWFDNVVYRTRQRDGVVFLRLTQTVRRTRVQIESELEMLRYLGDRQFPSTRAVVTRSGAMSIQCEYGADTVVACALTECRGTLFQSRPPSDLDGFCQTVGNTLGKLHRVLRDFEPSKTFTRMAWDEERWHRFAEVVPVGEAGAWSLYSELSRWWKTIESSSDYGLVHGDFTVRNMHYNEAGISLFDFDCCCEHFYAYDIACFLHFFSQHPPEQRLVVYHRTLAGYAEASNLSQDMVEQIPHFGRMKLLRGFLVSAAYFGLDNASPELQKVFGSRRQLFTQPSPWPTR